MKKFLNLTILLAGLVLLDGCKPQAVPIAVQAVTLSAKTLELTVGQSETLTATVTPTDAANKNITWASSNPLIATCEDGVVTAVAAGEAVITVTTEDQGLTDKCTVTVSPVRVTGVALGELTEEDCFLAIGSTLQLAATVAPENAGNKAVTWASSDEAVATVSQTGLVTGVAEGEVTITVKTVDGEFTAQVALVITVAPTDLAPGQGTQVGEDEYGKYE